MSVTGSVLDTILADVRAELALRRQVQTLADLRAAVRPAPERARRFVAALRSERPALIAECKRRSPSAGALAAEPDLAARAQAYARGGARAISVLTEPRHFGGSLADLAAVAPAGLPRLRKDFLLDETMVLESAAAGADAVLLIARVLRGRQLDELTAVARELGLATLIEVHGEVELERAVAAAPDAIGVNARDLATLAIDRERAWKLLARVPPSFVRVAESGIGSAQDLARARDAGADAALVGSALMRAPDPELALRAWREEVAHG